MMALVICWTTTGQCSISASLENDAQPVISSQLPSSGDGGSAFFYNYNAAWLPLFKSGLPAGSALLVRVQDLASPGSPYQVTPSKIAIAFEASRPSANGTAAFSYLQASQVILQPSTASDALGTEDPRVSYAADRGSYYLFYTAVKQNPDGSASANLALAPASGDPTVAEGWTQHGYVFPQLSWSKSGALLARPSPLVSYLFFGDSTLVAGLQVATSLDLLSYSLKNASSVWLPVRPDSFDSVLVEAGPSPLPLSDGSYLFLYNSARQNGPSPKPGWTLQYNLGWVILSGSDPTVILQRSSEPILSPDQPWELGYTANASAPVLGLTPNVVFVEGWQRFPGDASLNRFLIYIGGADSVVGLGQVSVSPPSGSSSHYKVTASRLVSRPT